ncbi:MAG TPA: Ig-like domain repeat protein [Solirubrobacteraceae bacterium]|nr:Ig-like domain repeat protein [Solirubrobacteraceae bacterium]
MTARGLAGVILGIAASLLAAAAVLATSAAAAVPAWTTYHHDGSRSGIDPDSTSPVTPTMAWQSAPLDGKVYGQPLVYGSRVYVATGNDSVYALDAATGSVIWRNHLATPVPQRAIPCTPIWPTVGIVSTPVIDPATGRIYVVGDTWDASNPASIAHEMFALNMSDGSVAVGPVNVDAPGSLPLRQLQRPGLALDHGRLFMGYGSYDDCGLWHGYVVSVNENGSQLQSFVVDGGAWENGGSVWASGNAPAIDSSGNVWVATGNGTSTNFDFQEAVIEFAPSTLNVLSYWAPLDWTTLDNNDFDVGSSMPMLLPNGLLFQIGKQGYGYLLHAGELDGVSPPSYRGLVCDPSAGSWGGGVYYGGVIYVACQYGMHAVSLNTTTGTFTPVSGWTVDPNAVGPPIEAGGLLWSADYNNGVLVGLDPSTGSERFSLNLGGFQHFTSPSAAGGELFVAHNVPSSQVDQITALRIATPPPPSPTATVIGSGLDPAATDQAVTLTASVSPGPDAGTVAFTDGGVPIADCGAVPVSVASGQAICTTKFASAGEHRIGAAYSGDSYYLGSAGTLTQSVSAPLAIPPTLLQKPTSALVISHLHIGVVHGRLRLSLTLSEGAKVAVAASQVVSGSAARRPCSGSQRHRRSCHVSARHLKLHLPGHKGRNKFVPRMRALPPGRYRIKVSAQNPSGGGSTVRTVLVVVRR